jgi:hypothetical protein
LLAIGCAAVVKLTPWQCLTHRMHQSAVAARQIASKLTPTVFFRIARSIRRRGGRFYSTFLNTNTNPTTISTIPSKLISPRRLP